MSDKAPRLVEPGWIDSTLVHRPGRCGFRILHYEDGPSRFEHNCFKPGRGWIVCAPSLEKHSVTKTGVTVTVAPSILCSDCGVHGFVREGIWHDAGSPERCCGGSDV